MKNNHYAGRLVLPLIATTLLSSCIIPSYDEGRRYSSNQHEEGVYKVLPDSFYGNAYYYDGHYHTGGDYQAGRYSYRGRQYTNRYYYKGTYMYGGRYESHGTRHHEDRDRRHDAYRYGTSYRR